MKTRVLLLLAFLNLCIIANAQMIKNKDLFEYANRIYGKSWVEVAYNLSQQIKLDKNNALTYVQVVSVEGKNKKTVIFVT